MNRPVTQTIEKMSEYQELIQTIALTMGVAWASGINLYATLALLGLGGATGYMDLPPPLEILQDPTIILFAGFMYCVEFMADKIPGVDTGWDALHTFIRIPVGAMLAFGAAGDVTPGIAVTAGILGGSVSAASHAIKSGTRVLINTSPEPFSNWGASIIEDLLVFAGLWAVLQHPVLFLLAFAAFLLALCWLLPKLLHRVAIVCKKLGTWLGLVRDTTPDREMNLKALADAGVLTDTEYRNARMRFTSS